MSDRVLCLSSQIPDYHDKTRITRTTSHQCTVCWFHCEVTETLECHSHVCIVSHACCATLSQSFVYTLPVGVQSAGSHYLCLSSQRERNSSDKLTCMFVRENGLNSSKIHITSSAADWAISYCCVN